MKIFFILVQCCIISYEIYVPKYEIGIKFEIKQAYHNKSTKSYYDNHGQTLKTPHINTGLKILKTGRNYQRASFAVKKLIKKVRGNTKTKINSELKIINLKVYVYV